ncbi:hypothetical protein HNO52_17430 [Billgrantia diversa]|uniref:hypothetical protein n=1 Tax=Halomonas sp. MCCC 1A13316 TaxID=2733487 RepID=UPI0018A41565|nr:hypothetical protein [Halomonas sp. MCCC 1A13316]QOR40100.1 hypothetical protein HNO52_17430 [Halomonas sp. MCCC 1A13316]
MSLSTLLQRRKAATVPAVPCLSSGEGTKKTTTEQPGTPGSPDSTAGMVCRVEREQEPIIADSGAPAPETDIDWLLHNLRFDYTGAPLHEIDDGLAGLIRRAMLPLDKRARAELATLIDDQLAHTDAHEAVQALLKERIEVQEPRSWLDWVRAECSLGEGDTIFVGIALERLMLDEQEQAARRYVAAWRAAAEAEAQPHRKTNAGRRAANKTLLPAREHPMATSAVRQPVTATAPPRLSNGIRMAHRARVDDKRLVLAGVPYTRQQAQSAVEARWPGADVEVVSDAD